MSSGKAKQFRRVYRQMGYPDGTAIMKGNEDYKTYKSLHGPAKKAFNNILRKNLYDTQLEETGV